MKAKSSVGVNTATQGRAVMEETTSRDTSNLDSQVEEMLGDKKAAPLVKFEGDTKTYLIDGIEYIQKKVLGNTHSSQTFLVESRHGHQGVVKTLKERLPHGFDAQKEGEAFEKFARESKILSQLEHPQIPQLYSTFTHVNKEGETTFNIFMEYFPSDNLQTPTLEEIIKRRGKIEEKEALHKIISLLDPLEYCHNQNPSVKHRDIKPSNIIWADGEAKLVDFGIVLDEEASTKGRDTIAGSPGYMAPEQWTGHPSLQSDIYNVGATLLHMLTGIRPEEMCYEDSGTFEEKFHVDYEKHTSHLDERLQKILDNCLALDAKDRYHSIAELRQALEGYLRSEPKAERKAGKKKASKEAAPRVRIEREIIHKSSWVKDLFAGLQWAAGTLASLAVIGGIVTAVGVRHGYLDVHYTDKGEVTVLVDDEGKVRSDNNYPSWIPYHVHTEGISEYRQEGIVGIKQELGVEDEKGESRFAEVVGTLKYHINNPEELHVVLRNKGTTGAAGDAELRRVLEKSIGSYMQKAAEGVDLETVKTTWLLRHSVENGSAAEFSPFLRMGRFTYYVK